MCFLNCEKKHDAIMPRVSCFLRCCSFFYLICHCHQEQRQQNAPYAALQSTSALKNGATGTPRAVSALPPSLAVMPMSATVAHLASLLVSGKSTALTMLSATTGLRPAKKKNANHMCASILSTPGSTGLLVQSMDAVILSK